MTWLKKEMEESARARENHNLHVRTVSKTRTNHKCKGCGIIIPIANSAIVVTEETLVADRTFYKASYFDRSCFLQKYPNLTNKLDETL